MSPIGSTNSLSPVSLLQQNRPSAVTPLASRPASPRQEDQPNPLETHELHCHQARGGLYAAQLKRARSQTPSTRSNSRLDCEFESYNVIVHPLIPQCPLFLGRYHLPSLPQWPHRQAVHDTSIVILLHVSHASTPLLSLPSRPSKSRAHILSSDAIALPISSPWLPRARMDS